MYKDYRFQVNITLLSPVISQAQQGTRLGVDTEAWEIEKEGEKYPALPGSLIRGNLLHSWLKLAQLSPKWISKPQIFQYLGQEATKTSPDTSNKPQRAQLRSSDNWIAEKPKQATNLHRIKIDKATGVVGTGMLQTLTAPHPVGREVVYRGWFEATLEASQLTDLKHKLEKGLSFISALGAFKGVGFGRVLKVQVNDAIDCEQDAELLNKELEDEFSLALSLDRPICFAKPHPDMSNRFESTLHIPGGAIKGAIATRIEQLQDPQFEILAEHLAAIRISHAHPCLTENSPGKRPSAIPLSLYFAEKTAQNKVIDECFDAASESEESTLKRHNIRFKSDWKEKNRNAIQTLFLGMSDAQLPQRLLKVKTAIDSKTNASKDEALFSVDTLKTDKHHWVSNINLEAIAVENRDKFKQALCKLLAQGLNSLGKTRAQTSQIKIAKPQDSTVQPTVQQSLQSTVQKADQVCILLQSDALLFDKNTRLPATNGANELRKIYQKSWEILSDRSLKLTNYFAKQGMYGGDYYWRRFCSPDEVYNPLLLTKAGSIFVLDIIDADKALEKLTLWQKQGISICKQTDNDWQTNPLVTGNGYGEIAINPQLSELCKAVKIETEADK